MAELPAVVATGKSTYKLQIPYKILETGPPGEKPLVVWLHGFGQTSGWMQKQFEPVWSKVDAYHLFVQAPYLLLESYVQKKSEGYSWYMFNGEKERYEESMEHAAEFLMDLISRMKPLLRSKGLTVCGYSQGAYLAGYLALSRPKHIDHAFMLAGRFKNEWVKDWNALHAVTLFGIHGDADDEVRWEPQEHALAEARDRGIAAHFFLVNGTHKINSAMMDKLFELLKGNI